MLDTKQPFAAPPPIAFAGNTLDRASGKRTDPAWIDAQIKSDGAIILPFFANDPLMVDGQPGFLSSNSISAFPAFSPIIFLGLDEKGNAYFALDATQEGVLPENAPFADIGGYVNVRTLAGELSGSDLAIIGQARWVLDWHRRHQYCAACGSPTDMQEAGAKRHCSDCGTDHFPRTEPVAIVLIEHEDHTFLGRGPHFPPGFLSCLAGFSEPGETIEECAAREVKEEAGLAIYDLRYQFSQPWPFPSSMMMGFFARTDDREFHLDITEIEEAAWLSRDDVKAIFKGDVSKGIYLPPKFTIARHLLERWVALGSAS